MFAFPNGNKAPASKITTLEHTVYEPASTVHIVPGLGNALLTASKFANVDYITVYD